MHSSENLERFYFQYQTKGLPKGISIQDFCINNKVSYNIFSKWYNDTRKKIVEVTVDGCFAFDCSEGMSEDRKSRYIRYLVDRVNETELDKKAMELVFEDFLNAQQAMKEELAEMRNTQNHMDSKLDEEVLKRKKAEREAEKLKTQLAFAKKNKFDKKQQKVTKYETDKSGEEGPERTDEKENFDGADDTSSSMRTDHVDVICW